MTKAFDIYIVGIGGQGVLTIGEFISDAAANQGMSANFFPTKGMSQRGGHVKAQLRLGKDHVGPSLPPNSADLVVSMEISETLKALSYLKPGGKVLLYGYCWAPTAVMLGKAAYPSLDEVKAEVKKAGGELIYLDPADIPVVNGMPVRANIYCMGAMMATDLNELFSADLILEMIKTNWPKAAEGNAVAFNKGLEAAKAQLK